MTSFFVTVRTLGPKSKEWGLSLLLAFSYRPIRTRGIRVIPRRLPRNEVSGEAMGTSAAAWQSALRAFCHEFESRHSDQNEKVGATDPGFLILHYARFEQGTSEARKRVRGTLLVPACVPGRCPPRANLATRTMILI